MKDQSTNPSPPRWALWLLRRVCPHDLYEMIEGDLVEEFEDNVQTLGPARARRRFAWNAIKFIRPGIINRNNWKLQINNNLMLRHFLKVFIRTSARNAAFTFINISGLVIGLTCAIFVLLWVWDETHFDGQHVLASRIYQVKSFHQYPDGNFVQDATTGALAAGLREFPEVQHSGRMCYNASRVLIQNGERSFYEEGVFADTSMFNILTIPVVEGVIFSDNNSIMLSQKAAAKYFPGESAVGKSVRINADRDATVTGVFENIPPTSTHRADVIMPYTNYSMRDQYNEEWGAWTNDYTYLVVEPGTDIKALDEKIHKAFTVPKIWVRWDPNASLFLFPFTDSHLRNSFNNDGKQEGGRIVYVQIFGAVGIFILIVAVINFMNLATARSVNRAKEIGVRKVSGAIRFSLIRQFFSESLLLAMISLIVALITVQLTMPSFNSLTQKQLALDLADPVLIGLIILITVLTGLAAGSYPAFLLSGLKPVLILKGRFTGAGGKNIRRSLVVFQFAISTVLVVCALAANQQIRYMKNKDLGFDRNDILYFSATSNINRSIDAFKKAALENPKVISVSQGRNNPMQVFGGMVLSDNAWPGKTKDDDILFTWTQCDEDYLPMLGLQIIKGRNFSKENPGDSLNFIINEQAARQMKLTDPIGASLAAPHKGTIIGVVNDFHTDKLEFKMSPMIIAMTPKRDRMVFVKYEHGQAREVLDALQPIYKSIELDIPMEYKFMDAPFGDMYQNELLIEKLSMYFTLIAIFISCLGLFGLASFTAQTRTKEIGVRKVLGASVPQIVLMLGRDFLILISFALAIGLPVGWWGVDQFLDKYVYHTQISAWFFISIAIGLMGITFITVGYQSAKAAMTNPVKTLRSE